MVRIFYMGAPSHINISENSPIDEIMKATGNNTGNLLIGHAIKKHISPNEVSSDFSLGYKNIEENFDLIVIGAANFIAPYFNFDGFTKFLENVNLPCIVIGLGAQAPNYGEKIKIPPGTERMIRIMSERSISLGVRGYFTASVLLDMGIKNVRVIGCPSMYWNCKPFINIRWQPGLKPLKVSLNGAGVSISQSFDVNAGQNIEKMLAKLSLEEGYTYVLQNERALIAIARGREDEQNIEPINLLMKRYGLLNLSQEEFIKFVRKNMRTYFDVDKWIDETKFYDFVIGTRFHGCLVALLAGIPCFVFAFDSRTREMCELLNIPHIDVRKVDKIDIYSLYDNLDITSLQTAYRYLYQNYIQFLNENHIVHSLIA